MKKRSTYSSSQIRRIVSLDKLSAKNKTVGYSSPQRLRKKRKPRRNRRKKRVSKPRSRFFGEWRLVDLPDKILKDHIFSFVDVYSIISNVCLVCVRFNKISMSSTVGRQIEDPQTIELILFHKPCDNLLYRLLFYQTIDCENDPSHVFQFSVKYNRYNTVRHMIETNIVDPSSWKNYAIQTASECGHLRIVKLLLSDKRVDPSVRDYYAIRSAWYNGHIEVVKGLLRDSKLKLGKELGYIPDYGEMMKSTGADIVELMDNEDRRRLSEESSQKKKIRNVIVIKKPSPTKSGEHRRGGGGDMSTSRHVLRSHNRQSKNRENRKSPRFSPIPKKAIHTPVNAKARGNLDVLTSSDVNQRSRKGGRGRGNNNNRDKNRRNNTTRRRKGGVDDDDEEEYDDDSSSNNNNNRSGVEGSSSIGPDSVLFDQRLRELEDFAKDMIFNRKELDRSISDSSFGEEHFEELERLREESSFLKDRLSKLERSVDIKQEENDDVLVRVRRSESKRKRWKNIFLSVVITWVLLFISFMMLDFLFPVQLYHGFLPS